MANQNYWENFAEGFNPFNGGISPLRLPSPLVPYAVPGTNADEQRTMYQQLEGWNWEVASGNILSQQAIPSVENEDNWNQHCLLHDHPTPVFLQDCPLDLPQDNGGSNSGLLNSHNHAVTMETPVPNWHQYSNLAPTPYAPRALSISPEREPAVQSRNRLGVGLQPARPQPSRSPWLRAAPSRGQSIKCQGEGCPKNFVPGPNNDGSHCARCFKKIFKNTAPPPFFSFEPSISSFDQAWQRVYLVQRPLKYKGEDRYDKDDFEEFEDREDYWIQRFIDAANTPYTENDGPNTVINVDATDSDREQEDRSRQQHEYFLAQQDTYNKKPYHDSSRDHFTNDEVNVRMRFLFRAVMTFHRGGPAVYPSGGDNRGYGEDDQLKCSKRLETICDILAQDKRVLITVIEGRGVNAFAANPRKYADRKTQNKISNETKKRLIVKGTEKEMADDERPAKRKRGPKKGSKNVHSSSPYVGAAGGHSEWRQ